MSSKQRLDQELVTRGIFESRTRAQAAIMAGDVTVNGQKADKPGKSVNSDVDIGVKEKKQWVSRGGDKMTGAIDRFGISPENKICMDIGAAHGGFTQVLLERGAKKLYAVDVGYGQFDYTLRGNSRLILMERTNARTLNNENISDAIDFLVMDVSFISIFKLMPTLIPLLSSDFCGIILFKPNFEAEKESVGKGGLLLDKDIHKELLTTACEKWDGFPVSVEGLIPSSIRGGDGNIEYFWYIKALMPHMTQQPTEIDVDPIVEEAFGDNP